MLDFKFFLLQEELISEKDINDMINDLEWEDIIDLYDDEELIEDLDEAISFSSRMKRSNKFRSLKSKVSQARKIKLKRVSDNVTITKRAKGAARRAVMKKLLKGRNKTSLSASEKDRLENLVRKILSIQGNVAIKFIPKVRDLERKRLAFKND
jgi:hypothetical protein